MILGFLLKIPLLILNAFTFWIPVITELPFGLDAMLVNGMNNVLYIAVIFPPILTAYKAFLFIVFYLLGKKLLAMIPVLGVPFRN